MLSSTPASLLRSLPSELAAALRNCKSAFFGIALFSGMINILMLTGSFFMLQVYDRVLPSRSVPTLIGLAILATALYLFQAILDVIRSRLLVRTGCWIDEALSGRVYDAMIRLPVKAGNHNDGLQSLRDLDAIRTFLSGLGPTALFDLPWIPLYLAICFAFHVWIGVTALVGALVLVAITIMTEVFTRAPIKEATQFSIARNGLAESSRRNAEVLIAMGMTARLQQHWADANRKYQQSQQRASDVSGGFSAVVKILRMLLQSAVLGVGAYLVIHQEATAGVIIAGSILAARALAPIDLAIANWRSFVSARQSWYRLTKLLELLPAAGKRVVLPRPRSSLSFDQVSVAPPGQKKVVAHEINFSVKSGNGLGIIGPSAAGKSSIARVLVGIWEPIRGKVRLDGAPIDLWTLEDLGRHVGYLPQDVALMTGSVAQNIARFEPNADSDAIIAAAKAAGVHKMIVNLGEGYETEVGEQGAALSAGQQQRIALARALYREPFLVVLDEPNSNLDNDGEDALTKAILGVRARGGIVVVIAHRPSALAGVDQLLVMNQGYMQAFGPKDEILNKVMHRPTMPSTSRVAVAQAAGGTL